MYRPLLLRTLVKGATTALVLSAITVYFVKSPYVNQSRFLLLGTFGLFFVFSAFLRLTIQARAYQRRVAEQKPVVLVVGQSARSELLTRRLSDLRGFSRWRRIDDAAGVRGYVEALDAQPGRAGRAGPGAQRRVRRRRRRAAPGRAAARRPGALAPRLFGLRHVRPAAAAALEPPALHALRGAGHARARQGAQRRRAPRQARARRRAGLGRPRRDRAAHGRHRRRHQAELAGPGLLPPRARRSARPALHASSSSAPWSSATTPACIATW